MKVTVWQRGFTLLEVMVVVVILGILAALVVPKIISRPDEARMPTSTCRLRHWVWAFPSWRRFSSQAICCSTSRAFPSGVAECGAMPRCNGAPAVRRSRPSRLWAPLLRLIALERGEGRFDLQLK